MFKNCLDVFLLDLFYFNKKLGLYEPFYNFFPTLIFRLIKNEILINPYLDTLIAHSTGGYVVV